MECLSTNCDGSSLDGSRTHMDLTVRQILSLLRTTYFATRPYKIFTHLALEIQSSILSHSLGFIMICTYAINLYHQRFSSLLFTVMHRWFPTQKSIDSLRPDKYSIALPEGFEPTTNRLTVYCSTTELWEHLLYQYVKELVVFVLYK